MDRACKDAANLPGIDELWVLSSFVSGYVIQAADAFSASLSGAALAGDVGTGVSLTTYSGDGTSRPVWDRNLDTPGTLLEGLHCSPAAGPLPVTLQGHGKNISGFLRDSQ